MSKIALVSPASGTATFNITVPGGTSTNRTLTLPDSAGDVVVTQATQTLTNKTFSGAQVFGTASLAEPAGNAPLYMCRAWVNFNGTTASPSTIRASGNVSSVTKNGTGTYTINFTTTLLDANYAVVGTCEYGAGGGAQDLMIDNQTAPTISSVRILVGAGAQGTANIYDSARVCVAIFR